jgi:HK97 family phage portal protein
MGLQTGIFSGLLAEQRVAVSESSALSVSAPGELRSSLENPSTPLSYPAEWLLDMWNGGRTDSGIRVSELTALQVTTFLSCVDLVAGGIASLPIHIYERSFSANGRAIHRVAYEHGLYELIHSEPNDEMSRFTFLKAYFAHVLAWGNGYAELQRDGGNQVVGIWPRNPYKTRPHRLTVATHLDAVSWRPFPVNLPAGTLVYRTTDSIDSEDGSELDAESSSGARIIPAADMLHVPGLALDGRIGQSVVWMARETIGLALAAGKFGSKYFANFAKPGGILEAPVALTDPQKESAKRSWLEAQGGENAHRVAVLPAGFKFTAMSHNAEDAQVIQTREFLRNEIASVFHVPPHMVGAQDRGKANTEQLAQEFVQYTLAPWLAAVKQEFKRKIFPSNGATPSRFYVDFDLFDLLRPDAASREKFNSSGRQWGYLNANDVRATEKQNPILEDWAEEYWMPVNMTLTTTPVDPSHQDGAGNGEVPTGGGGGGSPAKRAANGPGLAYGRMFRDAVGRALTATLKRC